MPTLVFAFVQISFSIFSQLLWKDHLSLPGLVDVKLSTAVSAHTVGITVVVTIPHGVFFFTRWWWFLGGSLRLGAIPAQYSRLQLKWRSKNFTGNAGGRETMAESRKQASKINMKWLDWGILNNSKTHPGCSPRPLPWLRCGHVHQKEVPRPGCRGNQTGHQTDWNKTN